MSSTVATIIWKRSQSLALDPSHPEGNLDKILNQGRAERAAARKAQGPSRKATGNKGPSVGSRSPPVTLGI